MRADSTSLCNGDASFAVINACYVLTDQYRCILSDLGKEHHLTENEMLVLVHLALYPDARTQKKLQATNLPLSVSSICRMVDSLRRKGYLSTCLEQKGRALAEEFRQCLHQRLGNVFQEIPGFDVQSFAAVMSQAAAFVQQSTATA